MDALIAALRRRLDAAYVARGGAQPTLESICQFMNAIEVEPDDHTITKYLDHVAMKQKHRQQQQLLASSPTSSLGGEGFFAVTSRSPNNLAKATVSSVSLSPPPAASRREFVSADDLMDIARQCIEVQRRRAVGGNDLHYLQLTWAGCGGDDEQRGRIRKQALVESLRAFGISLDDPSLASLPPSTSPPPTAPSPQLMVSSSPHINDTTDGVDDGGPMIDFTDLVALVSISKDVLELAAKNNDPRRVFLPLFMEQSLSAEERSNVIRQVTVLMRFKARMRRAVERRRERKRREKAREEKSNHRMSLSHHRIVGGGGGTSGLRGGAVKPLTIRHLSSVQTNSVGGAPSPRNGSVSSANQTVAMMTTATGTGRPLHGGPAAVVAISPVAGGGGEEGSSNAATGPDVLHHTSHPWHLRHPFESTRLDKDWIGASLPPVHAHHFGRGGGDGRRLLSEGSSSLRHLRNTLSRLLEEQQDALMSTFVKGNVASSSLPGGVVGHRHHARHDSVDFIPMDDMDDIVIKPAVKKKPQQKSSSDFSCQVTQDDILISLSTHQEVGRRRLAPLPALSSSKSSTRHKRK